MQRALSSCYHVEYSLKWEKNVLLDRDKSGKSNPWLQTQCCNENKTLQRWSSPFFLSACCKEAFKFTFCSYSLKIGHDHIFRAAGLVLSRCESTRVRIEIPTRIKTGGHGLTHREGACLAGINPDIRFAYKYRPPNKTFINNCFACRNDRWTTNNIFSNFFQKYFISFRESIDFCISWFV